MAEEKKPASKHDGPTLGADREHPMELDEWQERRRSRKLDPHGTWLRIYVQRPAYQADPSNPGNEPVPQVIFRKTDPPGTVADCPLSFDEYERGQMPMKGAANAYVKMPDGTVHLMSAPSRAS